MKLRNRNFIIVAALALLTNGSSLLGAGTASAGALARTIESLSNISRSIELRHAAKVLNDTPPGGSGTRIGDPFLFA